MLSHEAFKSPYAGVLRHYKILVAFLCVCVCLPVLFALLGLHEAVLGQRVLQGGQCGLHVVLHLLLLVSYIFLNTHAIIENAQLSNIINFLSLFRTDNI